MRRIQYRRRLAPRTARREGREGREGRRCFSGSSIL